VFLSLSACVSYVLK
jgi:hypothetical protein